MYVINNLLLIPTGVWIPQFYLQNPRGDIFNLPSMMGVILKNYGQSGEKLRCVLERRFWLGLHLLGASVCQDLGILAEKHGRHLANLKPATTLQKRLFPRLFYPRATFLIT